MNAFSLMRGTRRVLGFLVLVVLAPGVAALAGEGEAPKEPKSLKGPVQIRSDHLAVQQKEHNAEFSGNVVATQEDLTIHCEKLVVTYAGDNDPVNKAGEIVSMVFSGEVSIERKARHGHCRQAQYDRPAGKIVCTGEPWVVEGQNRIEGERIEYLLKEDVVRVTHPKAVLVLPEDVRKKETAP